MKNHFAESELIINPDGSIYHLNLLPEDIAPIIITVGDPDRVAKISAHFDHIELKKGKREFITHTGMLQQKRISVISTGIGTDNIDIVMNELDALANIDFNTRETKEQLQSLHLIRIGTSGTFQPDIEVGTILASKHAVGLDALMHYYDIETAFENQNLAHAILHHFEKYKGIQPYFASGSSLLLNTLASNYTQGITLTAPGFYAPQGRVLRAKSKISENLISHFQSFQFENERLTNLEMETAGIYAMAQILGHQALSINAILANRANGTFHPHPEAVVEKTIQEVLEHISAL